MNRKLSLPSLLPPGLHKLLRICLVLAGFMLANAVYLLVNRLADGLNWQFFSAGETSLPRFFQAMVLTHTGIGLVLASLLLAFFLFHLPRVWKRNHKSSVLSGIVFVVVGLALVVTGLLILTDAASRDNRWAWWTHVVCAALLPAGYAVHRLFSHTRPARAVRRRFVVIAGSTVVSLVLVHGLTMGGGESTVVGQEQDRGDPPARFVPVGSVSPESPFFPSAATTSSGGFLEPVTITRNEVTSSELMEREVADYGHVRDALIGAETCDRCHQDIVQQWAASAHRFASFNNPFYEATVNDLRQNSSQSNAWIDSHLAEYSNATSTAGRVKSKWCGGCHDPALMLSGRMLDDVDRGTLEAQAGVTCLACHAIDRLHDRTGNGNYNIADDQTDPYLFSGSERGTLGAFLHDAAVRAKPTVHKRQMLRPFFRDGEFCATCHKVSLAEPVNNYRWLRGQNEFDNWDDSGVSLNASRTFYLPAARRVCQECHMPLEPAPLGDVSARDGLVKSHRFVAVNTALPFVRGDEETLRRIEAFVQDEKLSVDIFALSANGGEPIMALDRTQPPLAIGDRVTVDVVVRNRGVGHTFPGGTNDSNQGWLEFTVRGDDGSILARSGYLEDGMLLDPMAHAYRAVLVDQEGKRISKRNAQDIHATVYANVIGPGSADIAHFEFEVPEWLASASVTLEARLLWRKFDREYTEFAFNANPAGFRRFSTPPELPVTEIASHSVSLSVKVDTTRTSGSLGDGIPEQWMRYNDYGIGLLQEGDTRGAARAFSQVSVLAPDRKDGPINLAKTAISDGNIERAYEHLRASEAIAPGDAQAAWVWGVLRQEDGRYDDAVSAYRRVLEVFPGDRAAWRNLGRSYYLNRQYEDAIGAYDEVLAIDPEDRIAHYHQMLCYRALGRDVEADRAASAYAYYSIDESALEITRNYRLENPGANLMAQKIRTHQITLVRGNGEQR